MTRREPHDALRSSRSIAPGSARRACHGDRRGHRVRAGRRRSGDRTGPGFPAEATVGAIETIVNMTLAAAKFGMKKSA